MLIDISRIAVGQVIAQVLNLLALPVLTRLYQPEVFGTFAVFSATTWILVIFATLQAEHLIVTMRTRRKAKALTFAILLMVLLFGVFIFALLEVVLTFEWFRVVANRVDNLAFWLSLTVVTISISQVLRYYATYVGQFKAHGRSAVLNAIALASVSIGFALYISGEATVIGLILGQAVGMMFSILPYVFYTDILHMNGRKAFFISYKVLRSTLGKLPVLIVTHLSKTLSFRVPVFMVANIGGEVSAGAFAMADRLMSIPTGVLGQAVGQVFRHRYRLDKDDQTRNIEQPKKVMKIAFIFALVSYGIFILLADSIILFLLGPDWAVVIPFVKIIAVMELMNFVYYSVEDVSIIRGIYYYRMLWQFGQLCALSILFFMISATSIFMDVEILVMVICTFRIVFIMYDLSRTWRNVKDINLTTLKRWLKIERV